MRDKNRGKTWRRRFGILCIAVAILMLICGETVLRTMLAKNAVLLLVYWMTCFILTALAAGVAIIEAARVGRENREEQRTLLTETLQAVEREKREREKLK
jgi:O-antigen ligase